MEKKELQNAVMLAPGGGPTLSIMGMNLAYKVSGAQTNGTWALLEYTIPPHFTGPPLHFHKVTYQGFYVLEGRVTFQVGSQVFPASPGSFVSVPAQIPHMFSNEQDQPARVLETIIPGGFEDFFKELVSLMQTEPVLLLKPHNLFDLYKRYDTFMPEEM